MASFKGLYPSRYQALEFLNGPIEEISYSPLDRLRIE